MMRPFLLRICLAVMAAYVLVPSVLAQQQGQSFKVTSTVTLTSIGPDWTFHLSGTGTGTIGDFAIEGDVTFVLNQGRETFAFASTTMMTADGDLYVDQVAHSGRTGAQGSYRITGGTGIYEGSSGAGAFHVVPNPDGTQTGSFDGSLVVPAGAP